MRGEKKHLKDCKSGQATVLYSLLSLPSALVFQNRGMFSLSIDTFSFLDKAYTVLSNTAHPPTILQIASFRGHMCRQLKIKVQDAF